MNWIPLKEDQTLELIKEESIQQPVLIFKHSTRCSISTSALSRLERHWKDEEVTQLKPYYLDLIAFRGISNKIQEVFNVPHESPQILIIRNGKCIFDASHIEISYEDIKKQIN